MNQPEHDPAGNGSRPPGMDSQSAADRNATASQDASGQAAGHPANPATGAASAAEPAALGSASVSEVERDLQQALAQAAEHQELYLRARAETENLRRRSQDELTKAHKFAIESFAEALVPVADSLEKALEVQDASAEQMRAGVELTLRQLRAAFDKNKLTAIDPAGQKFDPHYHQAISMVAAEGVPPNHVVAVLQKGWLIADRVLRPALVSVAQAT